MRVFVLFAIGLLFVGIATARADEAKPGDVAKERQSLEAFAAAHKTCREWTDGCMVCLRKSERDFDCSLPGIACVPSMLTCRATGAGTAAPMPPSAPDPAPPKTPEPKTPEPKTPEPTEPPPPAPKAPDAPQK